MSESYKPHLIADFKIGLMLNQKPWRLPPEAFTEIDNAYIHEGVITKRLGYEEFARFVNTDAGNDSYPDLPIMGIFNFQKTTGDEELLVCSTKRLGKYNATTEALEDMTLSDIFTGGDSNYFSGVTYYDKYYLSNGVDRLKTWDGTNLTDVLVDINDDAANNLNTTLFCVDYKSRLLLFKTTEDGTTYSQRVRWPKPSTTDYSNDGYVDAPTQDWITGYSFLENDLMVFFTNSTWFLKYTGDAALPYRWEMISSHYGGISPITPAALDGAIFNVAQTVLVACDGLTVKPMEDKIANVALQIADDKRQYCHARRIDELNQVWMVYPETGQDYSNKIFVFNYKDHSASTHAMTIHSLGQYKRQTDVTWDDIDFSWDMCEDTWDADTSGAGYPITLGGSRDGYVYYMNRTITDNGTNFTATLDTSKMNPYYGNGRQARFGRLDILADTDPDVSLTVKFYKDQSDTEYKTITITCSGFGEKSWFRIPINEVGSFHRVKIIHSGAQQINIYALMPWFKPAGRIV